MSELLEPNDEGTVCCLCRRPIVPFVEAHHGAYDGREARHFKCVEERRIELDKSLNRLRSRAKQARTELDVLRGMLKE